MVVRQGDGDDGRAADVANQQGASNPKLQGKHTKGGLVGMRNVAVPGAARIARSGERWHRPRRSGIYLTRTVP